MVTIDITKDVVDFNGKHLQNITLYDVMLNVFLQN